MLFKCLILNPLIHLMLYIDPESCEEFFTELIADSYLKAYEKIIEKQKANLEDLLQKLESEPGQTARGHLTLSSDQMDRGVLKLGEFKWLFWSCPSFGHKVASAATLKVQHRIKHYSLGTLTKLRG